MMDRLSIVQKTVMSIFLAGMALVVVIPLLFFGSVAFSNATEMSKFPKSLFPSATVTVKVVPTEEGSYEVFYDSGEGYEFYRKDLGGASGGFFPDAGKRPHGVYL